MTYKLQNGVLAFKLQGLIHVATVHRLVQKETSGHLDVYCIV